MGNQVVNYDVVNPNDIKKGDLFVMWAGAHTYLILEHAGGWTIWEQCGSGIGSSSGGTERTPKDSSENPISDWQKVRNHRTSKGYIVHHVKANHSIAEVDRARGKIRHKYDHHYCVVTRNCHQFCDEMLMELGHFAMGDGYL